MTLFSVLNGDVIRETFMDLTPDFPVVGQLYLYTFTCLFIYVVLNVFIAIVEESFFSTRKRSLEMYANVGNLKPTFKRFDWLSEFLDDLESDQE